MTERRDRETFAVSFTVIRFEATPWKITWIQENKPRVDITKILLINKYSIIAT